MKNVLLFLPQGFEAYEASVFTDVMGWSREVGAAPVDMVTTALRPEITCTWNLIVRPEADFASIDSKDFDALAIPGGFESAGFYEDVYDERFLDLIREFDRGRKPIAAVCVGALPVGKSGVLKGRKATTYDLPDGSRRTELASFGVMVRDERLVVDGNIITSTGPETGLDVAFTLLEMLTGKENVAAVRHEMRFG
ncbi:MAG: DJ-1/PfpI family protein [Balneolaceae bacterium]|nr:MAG: DJ-1/PfpI family protein [Balneolaceae bacterium]